jgi:hypothetical protein
MYGTKTTFYPSTKYIPISKRKFNAFFSRIFLARKFGIALFAHFFAGVNLFSPTIFLPRGKYIQTFCHSNEFSVYYFNMIQYINPEALSNPEFETMVLRTMNDGSSNFTGITHFTRVKSIKRGDEWDDVIYLRKRTIYDPETSIKNRDGGHVYVLTNPSWPGIVKIGFTTSDVYQRLSEINNAGAVVDWELEYYFTCGRPYDLEQSIHRHLEYCRSRINREFFEITVDNAKTLVENFGQYYGPLK